MDISKIGIAFIFGISLYSSVIIDYRIVTRTNPFTTRTGNHRRRILKLRRHIATFHEANRYCNGNNKET